MEPNLIVTIVFLSLCIMCFIISIVYYQYKRNARNTSVLPNRPAYD